MSNLRLKKLWLVLLLAILGGGYFSSVSTLDWHPLLKSYIAIIPLQIAALSYVAYWNWMQRSTPKNSWNKSE